METAPLLELVMAKGYERRDEPFPLSSGGWSRDYVDLRRAVAAGADLELASRAVAARLAEEEVAFEAIGGMTMGADPVAHGVALVTGRSWYSVRKQAKDHGRGQRVEGAQLGPGVRAVVFEDTVSTGRSLMEALEVVLDTGAEVACALTLLVRGERPTQRFEERGVRLLSLLSWLDLGIAPLD